MFISASSLLYSERQNGAHIQDGRCQQLNLKFFSEHIFIKSAFMVEHHTISLNTTGNGHMHDITFQVESIIAQSNLSTGICTVFNVGSTATVGTIEFEPGLEQDLPELLNKYMPPSTEYGHEQQWHDGNGHSHLQATTMGPSITIPFENSSLKNGTWQQIFHLECDNKPRNRTITVTLIGE